MRKQIGSALIILGDSFDVLKELEPVDSVITDPPYNYDFLNFKWDSADIEANLAKYNNLVVSHINQNNRKGGVKSKLWYGQQLQHSLDFQVKVIQFLDLLKVTDGGFILQFCDHLSTFRVVEAHNVKFYNRDSLVWVRNSGIPRGRPAYRDGFPELVNHRTITTNTYESIVVSQTRYNGNTPAIYRQTGLGYLDCYIDGEHITNVFTDKKLKTDKNGHPTSKPLSLMEKLVRIYCPKDKIVLDPFMGSGTTGLACLTQGRKFIGIEKDVKYFHIAEQRLTEFYENT